MAENMNKFSALGTSGMIPDAYYSEALLKMLMQSDFSFVEYGIAKPLPQNYGKTINFRRYTKLNPATTPLTEGVTPDGDSASGSNITATLNQYGAYMVFSDLAEDELFDDVKKEYIMAQGQQAQATLDNVVKAELETNGSVIYADGTSYATMDTAKSAPTIDLFRKAALTMSNAFIQPHEKGNGNYIALVDDNVMYDLFEDQKVKDYMHFGNTNKPMVNNWIADMYGIRFIRNRNQSTSSETLKDSAKHTIHNSFLLGAEAYGVVKLGGKDVQVFSKPLGSAGANDPLNQKSSIGWKINGFCAKILTPVAVQRIVTLPSNE